MTDTAAIRDYCERFKATAGSGAHLSSDGLGNMLSPDEIIALCEALDARDRRIKELEEREAALKCIINVLRKEKCPSCGAEFNKVHAHTGAHIRARHEEKQDA